MFYSHEILTSKKHGVATVWLVATIGQKSILKKVSRKAILNVNVPKACKTILEPGAPMALRLQASMLYGVSRVYAQQCGYVLADAQTAQNSMRALFNAVRSAQLDSQAGKARPEQLLLQDDPSFLLNSALPTFDLTILSQGSNMFDTQFTEASLHSKHSSQETVGDVLGGLVFPSDTTPGGLGGFDLARDYRYGTSQPGRSSVLARDDDGGLLLEDDIGIDEEGNIVELPPSEVHSAARSVRREIVRDGAASSRIRQEHEAFQATTGLGDEMDLDMPLVGDGYDFPEGDTSLSGAHVPPKTSSSYIEERIDTKEAAGAPLTRTARVPKSIAIDKSVELRKQDLADWMAHYSTSMQHALKSNLSHKVPHQAKKNAQHWILGLGLGGVGSGIGADHFPSPLADFAGNSLYEMITGVQICINGRKRVREGDSEEESTNSERRVRHRPYEKDVSRAAEMDLEDGLYLQDDDVELPREAQDAMDDITSAMPWNISASLRESSLPRGATSLLAPSSITGRGTRIVSASPLAGRSRPTGIDEALASDGVLAEDSQPLDTHDSIAEIAQFAVTDGNSQSQNAALDRESNNFLIYVADAIKAKQTEAEQLALQLSVDTEDVTDITFHDILSPEMNSKAAAAQGLMHVLTLGTKNLIAANQFEAFGTITMRVLV